MVVVDGHAHVSPVWWEPVELLLFQMDRNGVDQAVLTQFMGQTDNDYQFDCQRRYPGRFANVVIVDAGRDDAPDTLRRLAERGAGGVRLRPFARSPGSDPYAIWRTAGELDLTVSCSGHSAADFCDADFARLIQALPGVRFVIEHLGAMNHPDVDEAARALRQQAITLARFPNVFMKVPGLGEIAKRAMPPRKDYPFEEPIPPDLDLAYEAFGPERLMWGSDHPNTSHREGYANALTLCRERFSGMPKSHVDLIFGGVAAKLFPVR